MNSADSLLRALLAPLRTPQRVVSNIETIASALIALQRDAHERLASLDERVGALLVPLKGLDREVTELQTIERSLIEQTDSIRTEINTRLVAVEEEVTAMRSPIEQMSRDLATVVRLLPDPNDGPFARLRDTF